MKVTKLSSKQLLIEFKTRKEMNLTCWRMSEFSEGYEELRTYYTPDVFIDKWSDEDGKITYWEYWEGHNITKKKILEFAKAFHKNESGEFGNDSFKYVRDNVSNREIKVIELLDQIDDDGHVIFIEEGDEITFKHEIAHSYYFLYPEYKTRADSIVYGLPPQTQGFIKKGLREMKYSDDVLQDEIQAYLTAYDQEEWDECFPEVKLSEVLDATILLNQLYNERCEMLKLEHKIKKINRNINDTN